MANKVAICNVDTNTLPKLKNEELMDLMRKIKSGDELAREMFVVANLRLVLSVVHRFGYRKEKADDMFQVGCVGLMKAIDNFDTTLNVRFSTYAVPMIVGEIRRFIRDNNSIRVSRSLRDIAYKALKARELLTKEWGYEPTVEQISRAIEIDVKHINFALDAISDTVSLNDPAYTDSSEGASVLDQIADSKNSDENMVEHLALSEALKKLSGREKQIIMMRYYIGKTQMEVSEEIGISQAQVSRLEKNALASMKKNF